MGHYVCSVCEKYLAEDGETVIENIILTKLPHAVGEWQEKSDATCTEDGKTTFTASFTNVNFGQRTTEVTIEATGHSLEHTPAKAATCETDGNVEYWKCSVCKGLFLNAEAKPEDETTADKVVDPQTGHDYKLDETIGFVWDEKYLTCAATGTCKNVGCEEPVVTVTVNRKSYTVSKAATCIAEGDTTYTAEFTDDWIPKEDRVQTKVVVGKPQ